MLAAFAALVLLPGSMAGRAFAQESTPVHNTAPLHPPAGARVAIVEFGDLECPGCARANSLLKQAAEQYKIPWVRHDFPLPQHDWSFQAAVNARWFDTKSKKLGDEYRDAVFAHQDEITVIKDGGYDGSKGLPNLHAFTEKFAADHKIALPFVIDPQGKLAAEVKADYALGQSIGIQHTPHHLGGHQPDQGRALRRSRRSHQALLHDRRRPGRDERQRSRPRRRPPQRQVASASA